MTDRGPLLLSLDIGTTHCKAALFSEDGTLVSLAKMNTLKYEENGWEYYDPVRMWDGMVSLIRETAGEGLAHRVAAVGITSMAETGLLVDPASGLPRSPFIPWFSRCSVAQAGRIESEGDRLERFAATGLRASYKYGLAKLLWLKERDPSVLDGAVWLSASDYAAYRLSGVMATDYTLAARTYGFRIDRKMWDEDWIRHFGLSPSLFPEACPAGSVMGRVNGEAQAALGIPAGVPVIIAGHDHVAASLAAGVVSAGRVMDSIGTAETLVGIMPERGLTAADWDSGLSFGSHPVQGHLFWMGGLSSSGGSVEWFRSVLSEPSLSYDGVLALLAGSPPGPSGILYFPYLNGSGAPKPDAQAKAAWIGLTSAHGKADLLKSMLEGTAFEMESIRRVAELSAGAAFPEAVVTGGGTHNPYWLQIKSDVSGLRLACPDSPETALLGAAMLAGIGCGMYSGAGEAAEAVSANRQFTYYEPSAAFRKEYGRIYEQGYLPLQQPLRMYSKTIDRK